MKNTLIALASIFALMALASCGAVDQTVTHWTGAAERCYKGVVYVNFTTGTSPVYRVGPNGEPLLTAC